MAKSYSITAYLLNTVKVKLMPPSDPSAQKAGAKSESFYIVMYVIDGAPS